MATLSLARKVLAWSDPEMEMYHPTMFMPLHFKEPGMRFAKMASYATVG